MEQGLTQSSFLQLLYLGTGTYLPISLVNDRAQEILSQDSVKNCRANPMLLVRLPYARQ